MLRRCCALFRELGVSGCLCTAFLRLDTLPSTGGGTFHCGERRTRSPNSIPPCLVSHVNMALVPKTPVSICSCNRQHVQMRSSVHSTNKISQYQDTCGASICV
uniref:Secreted protein n=1 Tax=Eutreptiella gymnastica TaxID=73025 RepID=A0A7S4FUJ9_9EUGL|mmetsp:Transcript_69601/g.111334  ORF Transcript_69601/g.111334 Transcript_69601/m.111334 type:complete len:103 (+) Transcript_69601:270-578(+)